MTMLFWGLTFAIIVGLGIYAGRQVSSASDWALAGRSLGIGRVAAVLGAWQIGGVSIMGCAQDGYELGLSGGWYTITGAAYFCVLMLAARMIREKMTMDSVPGFFRERFGRLSGDLYSYIYIVFAFLYIPIQLFTMATVIQLAVPGISLEIAAIIGLILATAYTSFSGMMGASEVGRYTCFGIYAFVVGCLIYMLNQTGGFADLRANLPAEFFSMGNMPKQQIIGWIITGVLSSVTMQAVLQPILSAKSTRDARLGTFFGMCIAAPIGIIVAIIGMIGRVNVDIANSATAFASTISHFMPPAITGIVFGTVTLIVSTTMSTQLMAATTILTDLYKEKIKPESTESETLKFSRISTIVFAALCMIPVLFIKQSSITSVFMILTAVATAPMSFSLFSGLFWERATYQGSVASIVSGFLAGVIWWATGKAATIQPVYIIVGVSYSIGIIVSLMTQDKNKLEQA